MRTAVIVVSALLLGACSLLGGGDDANPVPPGDAWRTEVVQAIEQTPGVTSTQLSVNDVDSGMGRTGPVLTGYFVVTGDAEAVVTEAMRRASDVLGEQSAGVRINVAVTDDSGPRHKLRDYGLGDVTSGKSLWDATH